MRSYTLTITDSVTGAPIKGADGVDFGPYTSLLPNGDTNQGALNIEFDIPISTFNAPVGAAYIKVWGVSLTTLGQSSNFNGARLQLTAGMARGLPLANTQKAPTVILDGIIQQAFGNWQGTQQTLDFVVIGNYGTYNNPVNLPFVWSKGQQLAEAAAISLAIGFPQADIEVNTTTDISLPYDMQSAQYQTVNQLSEYISNVSRDIVGTDYEGLLIVATANGFKVFDSTQTQPAVQIQFTDLIGQPTWIGFNTINFKTVLRGDIIPSSTIAMPLYQGLQTTLPQSFSQYRDRSTFQGNFFVTSVRHLGHFRQRPADSWCTVIEGFRVE